MVEGKYRKKKYMPTKKRKTKRNQTAIFMSSEIIFKTKRHYLRLSRSLHNNKRKNITVMNSYASNNRSSKYVKQKPPKVMHRKIKNSTISGEF